MELYVGIAVVVLIALYLAMIYNGLVRNRNQSESAWRQIDVQLKRRHDLIPNLVEATKDYMSYEQETLRAVVEARNQAAQAAGSGDRHASIVAEQGLGAVLGRFMALFENYPDLKANQNVADLTEELTTTENRIAFARQHYNDTVQTMNTRVESFPVNLLAGTFGFGRLEYFETPEPERAAIKVDLR